MYLTQHLWWNCPKHCTLSLNLHNGLLLMPWYFFLHQIGMNSLLILPMLIQVHKFSCLFTYIMGNNAPLQILMPFLQTSSAFGAQNAVLKVIVSGKIKRRDNIFFGNERWDNVLCNVLYVDFYADKLWLRTWPVSQSLSSFWVMVFLSVVVAAECGRQWVRCGSRTYTRTCFNNVGYNWVGFFCDSGGVQQWDWLF